MWILMILCLLRLIDLQNQLNSDRNNKIDEVIMNQQSQRELIDDTNLILMDIKDMLVDTEYTITILDN